MSPFDYAQGDNANYSPLILMCLFFAFPLRLSGEIFLLLKQNFKIQYL